MPRGGGCLDGAAKVLHPKAGQDHVSLQAFDTTTSHLTPVFSTTIGSVDRAVVHNFSASSGGPDVWIANLTVLIGPLVPIQFYSCFISHSSADKDFARRLFSRMRGEGLPVWFDEEDMVFRYNERELRHAD